MKYIKDGGYDLPAILIDYKKTDAEKQTQFLQQLDSQNNYDDETVPFFDIDDFIEMIIDEIRPQIAANEKLLAIIDHRHIRMFQVADILKKAGFKEVSSMLLNAIIAAGLDTQRKPTSGRFSAPFVEFNWP